VRSERGPCVSLPLWIVKATGIKDSSKIFWARLKAEYADQRIANPSRAELAADLGISVDSVDRYTAELRGIGALRIVENTDARAAERGPRELQLVETEESRNRAARGDAELRPSQRALALVEPEMDRHAETVRESSSSNSTFIQRKSTYSDRFLAFWKMYPQRKAKANAYAWWLTHNVDSDTELWGCILAGLQRWNGYWSAKGTAQRYIPYPKTWLGQRHFLDEVEDLAPVTATSTQTQGLIAASHRFLKRHKK
jgi:hypothetical protein